MKANNIGQDPVNIVAAGDEPDTGVKENPEEMPPGDAPAIEAGGDEPEEKPARRRGKARKADKKKPGDEPDLGNEGG